MGTEASFMLDHSLSIEELAALPNRLNRRFRQSESQLQLRWHLPYRGTVVLENGTWVWREDEDRGELTSPPPAEPEWQWLVTKGGAHDEPLTGDTTNAVFRELLERDRLHASGPFCLGLFPTQHAVDVATQVNWDYFVLHDVVQTDLLQVARGMGQVLHSRMLVIYPDDIQPMCDIPELVRGGRTLNSVVEGLSVEPAAEIGETIETVEFHGQPCCEARGFYVEHLPAQRGDA